MRINGGSRRAVFSPQERTLALDIMAIWPLMRNRLQTREGQQASHKSFSCLTTKKILKNDFNGFCDFLLRACRADELLKDNIRRPKPEINPQSSPKLRS